MYKYKQRLETFYPNILYIYCDQNVWNNSVLTVWNTIKNKTHFCQELLRYAHIKFFTADLNIKSIKKIVCFSFNGLHF